MIDASPWSAQPTPARADSSSARISAVFARSLVGLRRVASVMLVCVIACAVAPSTAGADPVGPTNYRSEVVGTTPATSDFSARILGGDSFLELTSSAPFELTVVGYRGEDYLRFDPDGTVWENQASPTSFLNLERYGEGDLIPDEVSAESAPEWVEVSSGGRYAWHDHRAHRMDRTVPLGVEAGGQVLESVIPLRSENGEYSISVESYWQGEPSALPLVVGVVIGIVGWAIALWGIRRTGWLAAARMRCASVLFAAAVAATWLVATEWVAFPQEAQSSWADLFLPVVAVLASALAWATLRAVRSSGEQVSGDRLKAAIRNERIDGASLLAAAGLLVWSGLRRAVLTSGVMPEPMLGSDGFTRGVVVCVFVISAACAVALTTKMVRRADRSSVHEAP